VTVRTGIDSPRAGSDIFSYVTKQLTVNRLDFRAFNIAGDVSFRLQDRLHAYASVGHSRSVTASEFRDFIDNNDMPIEQKTTFARVPVILGARFYLTEPGRSVARRAWIPSRLASYAGGGGGVTWYRFTQQGDFVGFQNDERFSRHVRLQRLRADDDGVRGTRDQPSSPLRSERRRTSDLGEIEAWPGLFRLCTDRPVRLRDHDGLFHSLLKKENKMYKRVKRIQLFLISSIILAIFAPREADAATQAATDARWRPWLGCWATNDDSSACIVPSASPTAVELVTLSAGKEVYRETIDASGEEKDRTFEGCDGWESGRWSDDGLRLYLNSEYRCGNGSVRTGKELFTISPAGDWVDSISVTVNENTGVRTTRRRAVPPPDAILREFAGMNTLRPLSRTDTINPPIGFAEIVEASRLLDGPVVEAWLSVVQPRMKVNSRGLINLTRAGVPEGVLDLLVALAYPKRFSVEPAAPIHSRAPSQLPSFQRRPSPIKSLLSKPFTATPYTFAIPASIADSIHTTGIAAAVGDRLPTSSS
jgi:hypothetical protein